MDEEEAWTGRGVCGREDGDRGKDGVGVGEIVVGLGDKIERD